jgi:hypothetical protein
VAASTLAIIGIITAMAISVSAFLLMLGYVYRDARRRNMNAPLWTLLVFILAPSSLIIGLIIYLLVREPLPYPCPRCGSLVGPRFNFCSSCKCNLHPSCPNLQAGNRRNRQVLSQLRLRTRTWTGSSRAPWPRDAKHGMISLPMAAFRDVRRRAQRHCPRRDTERRSRA